MSEHAQAAIETTGLRRSFGDLVAVDGIDLRVDRGELFSLLGPNAAGKTTTIRMLSCLLRPTDGEARILGHDVVREPLAAKASIAISPQETAIAEHLNAWENLALMAGVHGVDRRTTARRSADLLDTMGLGEDGRRRAKQYSGGMKRRLSIAMALVSDPEIVFLDEPTIGLDPQARRSMWEHIDGLKGSTTIVLTTHYLEEADALADRLAIIDHGRVIAAGTPSELKTTGRRSRTVVVEVPSITQPAFDALRARFPSACRVDGHVEIDTSGGDVDVGAISDCLRPFDLRIDGVYHRHTTLDDVFLELTGRQLRS